MTPLLAQILAQQAQQLSQPHRISSYGQLGAELGAALLQKRGMDKAEKQQRDATRQIVEALMGRGNSETGAIPQGAPEGPVPLPAEARRPDPLALALQNPEALQGNPILAQILMQRLQPQENELMNVPQGGAVFDPRTGQPVFTNQGSNVEPPKTRTFQVGEENVTQEWDPATRTWREVGRGSRTIKQETLTGELSRNTGAQMQEQFFNAQAGLDRLKAVRQTFKPEFLTIGGRLKAKVREFKDIAGMDLTPDERRYLGQYTEFTANAYDNLNRYIKEITGAAMTNQEADRIQKALPNPASDSPEQFRSKYDAAVRQLQRAVARTRFALTQNKPIESFSLDRIDSVIDARGKELEKQYKDTGLTDQQIKEQVKAQLRQEFGL